MTLKEFSDTFDVLLNSYSSPTMPSIALDEYEKSVFLTQALEQLVIELYTGRNNLGASFEKTEELRTYLRDLIKTKKYELSDLTNTDLPGISNNSKFYTLPADDLLFITYEVATLDDENAGCFNGKQVSVVPVTQDEYWRISRNPFRQANKRKVIRLDHGPNIVELISPYTIKNYTIRYLSKPSPIILENLENLTIGNKSKKSECELNSALHNEIVARAVTIALATRGVLNKNNV